MEIMISAMILWISSNFDLQATDNKPRIEFVAPETITTLRYRGLVKPQTTTAPVNVDYGREVVSVYDDRSRTIYLPVDWKGASPAELSVLVHELVHHLQNVSEVKYACPQEREKLAYAAQEKWLNMFKRDLEQDFGIDKLTLLSTTVCY